jgi:hypothetical protein
MGARRILALLLVPSLLAGCGLLIGVEELGVDPSDASAPVVVVEAQAPDVVDAAKPPVDASVVDASDATVRTSRRVFLTSTQTKGAFDGATAGADKACTAAATTAKLGGGPWVAWLSGNGKNAIDRITYDGPYVRLDNAPVVPTSGKLDNPINVMENGNVAPGNDPWVWTGTLVNGVASVHSCNAWTFSSPSTTVYGMAGSFDQATDKWTNNDGPGLGFPAFGCQANGRFYCFEQ